MSVVSARVDRHTVEVLKKAGVNVGEKVKGFLQDLAWEAELKGRLAKLDKALEKMPPAERGFSAKSVNEDRVRD